MFPQPQGRPHARNHTGRDDSATNTDSQFPIVSWEIADPGPIHPPPRARNNAWPPPPRGPPGPPTRCSWPHICGLSDLPSGLAPGRGWAASGVQARKEGTGSQWLLMGGGGLAWLWTQWLWEGPWRPLHPPGPGTWPCVGIEGSPRTPDTPTLGHSRTPLAGLGEQVK